MRKGSYIIFYSQGIPLDWNSSDIIASVFGSICNVSSTCAMLIGHNYLCWHQSRLSTKIPNSSIWHGYFISIEIGMMGMVIILGLLVKKLHFDGMHLPLLAVIMPISSLKISPKVGAMPTKLKIFQLFT